MADPIAALLKQRLIVVTGKGGVGKTSLAASLALRAAAEGRRVGLFEMSHTEALAPLFGHPPVAMAETRVRERLFIANLDPKACFERFVLRSLKSKTLYRLLFSNRLVDSFIQAIPGLDSLLVLAELLEAAEWRGERRGVEPPYDLVILDAPATGHGLTLINTPRNLMTMLGSGPIHSLARRVFDRLADPAFTSLQVVTLPEEMPVNECLELHRVARETLEIPLGPVILNAMPPAEIGPAGAALLSAGDSDPSATLADRAGVSAITAAALTRAARTAAGHSRDRRRAAEERAADLDEGLARPALRLPLLTGARFGFAEIETLAGVLAEQLDRLAEEEGS